MNLIWKSLFLEVHVVVYEGYIVVVGTPVPYVQIVFTINTIIIKA